MIGFDYFFSCSLNKHVQVNFSTDGDEAEGACTISIVEFQYWGHGGTVSEEESHKSSALLSLKHNEGVHARKSGSALAIIRKWGLAGCPHIEGTWLKLKLCLTVAQTIDILRGKLEIHLDVLIGEDEGLAASVKEPALGVDNIMYLETEVFFLLVIHLETVELKAEI